MEFGIPYCAHCGHYLNEADVFRKCEHCGAEYTGYDYPDTQEFEKGDFVRVVGQPKDKKFLIKDVKLDIPDRCFLYEDMYLLEGLEELGYIKNDMIF